MRELHSTPKDQEFETILAELKASNKLSALPIGPVNWSRMTIETFDGRTFKAYGTDGTWVEDKPLQDSDIRYLGSASHAGKIELKALFVLFREEWHNILTGETTPLETPNSSLASNSNAESACSHVLGC